MTLNEKLDVVEEILKEDCHYKERKDPGYNGPCIDYVRNDGSVDVFSENETAFFWAESVVSIVESLGLTHYINYDRDRNRVFAHIYWL